ncbi:MAG: hypothetical protein ACJ72E_03210 [Marmoricola sp.]
MRPVVKGPVALTAYTFGVVRGFVASMIRVAAGEQGPVIPGYLPGPVAAPVEEDVEPEDITPVIHLHPRTEESRESRES